MTRVNSMYLGEECIRAISIDVMGDRAVVGCRNGKIYVYNNGPG
jgi:hypothetical protein